MPVKAGAVARTRLDSFESIERLMTVEMRLSTLPQGFVARLASAARGTGSPVVHQVAEVLRNGAGGKVAIFTGIVIHPYLELGETDGVVGSVVLAKALETIGYAPELYVEAPQVEMMCRLCERSRLEGIVVRETSDFGRANAPRLAIAIEKIAKNAAGVRHSLLGTPLREMAGEVDAYFTDMLAAGITTIGIGDGGNEIGFGGISAQTTEILGASAACACGCAGGVVAATPTTFLIAAATANLGAYATIAALALATERGELCAEPAFVHDVMTTAVELGFIDAGTLDRTYVGEDGVPADAVEAFVRLLRTIVLQELEQFERRPF